MKTVLILSFVALILVSAGCDGTPKATATGAIEPADTTSRPGFNIDLVFVSGDQFSAGQRRLIEEAAAMWESVITTGVIDFDFDDVPFDTDGEEWWSGCGWDKWFERIYYRGRIDDLRVYVTSASLSDGIYGYGGPILSRGGDSRVPIMGVVVLNDQVLEGGSDLLRVAMVHELGHVLGFGRHDLPWTDMLALPSWCTPGEDTHFTGQQALRAFEKAGGRYDRDGVPVEHAGIGRDTHWRESVFGNEIMTIGREPGVRQVLSAVTVQALGDLGYKVDPSRAEPYRVPAGSRKVVASGSRWSCGVGRVGHYPVPRMAPKVVASASQSPCGTESEDSN